MKLSSAREAAVRLGVSPNTFQRKVMATSLTLVKPDEQHYTPEQIAQWWNLDTKTIRQIFRNEEGVLRFGRDRTTRLKRAYTTLRIPHSVMQRVYRRMLSGSAAA